MAKDQLRILRWSVALSCYGKDDRRGTPMLLPVLPHAVGILMPFKKERYPRSWPEIRARILQRDGNRCKTCRAPNGQWISRDKDFQWGVEKGAYMLADGGEVFTNDGTPLGTWRGSEWEGDMAVKVVLTVAHLDHDEARNSDDNLASLCQRCRLAHDRADNLKRAKKTRHARKADRELF